MTGAAPEGQLLPSQLLAEEQLLQLDILRHSILIKYSHANIDFTPLVGKVNGEKKMFWTTEFYGINIKTLKGQ